MKRALAKDTSVVVVPDLGRAGAPTCPHASARLGPAPQPTSSCHTLASFGHLQRNSPGRHPLPTRLRVALVDSDRSVHEFVRQAFEKHAPGWDAGCLAGPDSALRDLGCLEPPPAKPAEPPCPNAKHARGTPDVLLFETQWPDLSGFERLRTVATRLPGICGGGLHRQLGGHRHYRVPGGRRAGLRHKAGCALVFALRDGNRVVQGQPFLCSQAQGALVRLLRRTVAGNVAKS